MYLFNVAEYTEFEQGYILHFRLDKRNLYPFEYMVTEDIELNFEPIIYLN